jgi:hypothetical protein
MSSIKIKVKSWDSAGNVVPKTQTVELNKYTAFNLQGLGVSLNFIGKIIKRGDEYILINDEDSTYIQEYRFVDPVDGFTVVQNLYGSNLNFWESEESFPEADAPVTLPATNRAGEEKKGPDYNDGGIFLAGGRKKKKRKTKRRKRKRRRKKSTKSRRRKKRTKRRRKRRGN